MAERRRYRREPEEKRREQLMRAALELIAEGGPQAATVRGIAARAGVTPGLIRHYFQSKEALTRDAYRFLMDGMTQRSAEELEAAGDAKARLAAFVAASVRPPVLDAGSVGLWAGFLHGIRNDPEMREVHRASYLAYRDRLEGLIAALGRKKSAEAIRRDAIACNAVIDGLWMEGSLLPDAFASGELVGLVLSACGAILGVELPRADKEVE